MLMCDYYLKKNYTLISGTFLQPAKLTIPLFAIAINEFDQNTINTTNLGVANSTVCPPAVPLIKLNFDKKSGFSPPRMRSH